ncbi:twin-arginine translocase subunit TatC [Planosporangium sp. 12N6]|uniref:twin-arginine translocase subunit TatC n=1 Tax=Planosporangium spinosum TaxID=3402278 RepID=UPI003CF9B74C
MALPVRRRKKAQFTRAADGSMTLMEHLQELRSRLFKASLAVVAGLCVGYFFARPALDFMIKPYCDLNLNPQDKCAFVANAPMDPFLLNLRIALYLGLLLAAPFWLYQLWAFIAPGLHRHERRYTYAFAAVAAPLFFAGATLAFFIVSKSLHFFLGDTSKFSITIGLPGYFDFVTNMMLLFGAGFEFPLIVVMLNLTGMVSARKLLSWWRVAVFLMFVFGAVVTPTPDPFGMTALAGALALLYFAAVGFAFLNDRRRRQRHAAEFGNVSDDEISPLEYDVEPVEAGAPVDASSPVDAPSPVEAPTPVDRLKPLDTRFDDFT